MSDEMYELLHKILSDRSCRGQDSDWTYRNVLQMLEYAHEGNYECLVQFDCEE